MAKRMTQIRYAVIALIILLVAAGGYLLIKTAGLNKGALRTQIASHLSAWSGGPVVISGPLRLGYFPSLSLKTRKLILSSAPNVPYLKKISAKSLTVEFDLWSVLTQKPEFGRIVLEEPEIVLNHISEKSDTRESVAGKHTELIKALRSMPIRDIMILNGTAILSGSTSAEKLSALNAQASLSLPGGEISVKGDMQWHDEPVSFSLKNAIADPDTKPENKSFTLSIRSPEVSADLDGESVFTNGLQVMGDLDLEIPDMRRFAHWLGLLIPDGQGLGYFSASGPFHWHGSRMGFNDGSFSLDGNRALGTLGLEVGGVRPKIDGTLAVATLTLSQYLDKTQDTKSNVTPLLAGKDARKSRVSKQLLNFPLLHHFDLDLRLSTTQILARPISLGQTALSIAVKSGHLIADFATLDVCGGNGSGRLSFDAAVPDTEVRLTGNMTGVSLKACIETLMPASPLSGNADLSLDLASQGRTKTDLLTHLRGKAIVKTMEGEIALNLAVLAAVTQPETGDLWQKLHTGSTKFSNSSAELIFRKGSIYASKLGIVSGKMLYSGEGTVDYTAKKLDFRLSAKARNTKITDQGPVSPAKRETVILMKGPWLKPDLQIERPVAKPEQ